MMIGFSRNPQTKGEHNFLKLFLGLFISGISLDWGHRKCMLWLVPRDGTLLGTKVFRRKDDRGIVGGIKRCFVDKDRCSVYKDDVEDEFEG